MFYLYDSADNSFSVSSFPKWGTLNNTGQKTFRGDVLMTDIPATCGEGDRISETTSEYD